MNSVSNPLLSAQRETAGASTYEKYEYQYHWALFRALREYELGHEFVIFVELHEDVILSTSLQGDSANFHFNQIKNVSGAPWTVKKITARQKSGKNLKNSVIGKMLQGVNGKSFKDKVEQLNLVATCGFNLKLKDDTLNLSLIKVGHLHQDCISDIEAAISKELGPVKLPASLGFIKPDLPANGFDHFVVSKISEVIDKQGGGAFANIRNIYRVLMDDLRKKGVVTFDYENWDDLLKNKGLTNLDVDRVASLNTRHAVPEKIEALFDQIVAEMGLHMGQRTKLKRAYQKYENEKKYTKTTIQLEVGNRIKSAVKSNIEIFEESGINEFLKKSILDIPDETSKTFQNIDFLNGAVIYELISELI